MFISFPTRKTGMCAMVNVPVLCVVKVAVQVFSGQGELKYVRLFGILTQDRTQNMEIVDMAASIIEISEQRGLQQGIRQGEIQAKQEALLKVLQHRFQSVPEAVMTRVRALRSPVELDLLFERGLTAESLEELQ